MTQPRLRGRRRSVLALLAAFCLMGVPAAADPAGGAFERALESVVSILPTWPDRPASQGRRGDWRESPEGSGVAVLDGRYVATNLHVVGRAIEIRVRLADERVLPAELVGRDPATDLALLRLPESLPPFAFAEPPPLGGRVCAIGNQFGLGLSLTCGVVSAVGRTDVGFNAIEDFVQTDAAVNPGGSGGALIDNEGRLVGLVSAILTKESDANVGVNFAASARLVRRVVEDLARIGRVDRPRPGFVAVDPPLAERRVQAGARVARIVPEGPAATAGLAVGDLVIGVEARAIRRATDAMAELAMHRPGDRVSLAVRRGEQTLTLELVLPRP